MRTTMASMLFAYGTLLPGDPEDLLHEGWSADAVRGRLYDLGAFPALVGLDDPAASWVEGSVKAVREQELESYDAWEDVANGLFQRAATTTRNGYKAWVYVYARPVPAA